MRNDDIHRATAGHITGRSRGLTTPRASRATRSCDEESTVRVWDALDLDESRQCRIDYYRERASRGLPLFGALEETAEWRTDREDC